MIHDRQITISIGQSRTATVWKPQQFSIAEFYARLEMPQRSVEPLAEYLTLTKAEQDSKKDVGGFVGGKLNGPRRKAENVLDRCVVTLDYDSIPTGMTEVLIKKVDALGCSYSIYSTRKHRPEAPRLRVVVPLDREAIPDEYECVARLLADRIGMSWADPTTFEPSRLMYWPSCCADGEYVYRTKDAPLMPVDEVLQRLTVIHGTWLDQSTWPRHPNENKQLAVKAARRPDPASKGGAIGTFCRLYDVFRTMDELIPGTYTPTANPDRFTYVDGSTTGGAVVYDGGKFLYSHHSTDPCSGLLVNAFDLLRVHKFGHMDGDAAPETPVNRLQSYTAAMRFISELPEVAAEFAEAAAKESGLLRTGDTEWVQKLDMTAKGGLCNTLNNMVLILQNDERFVGKIRADLLRNDAVVSGDLPWKRPKNIAWRDTDTDQLQLFFARTFDKEPAPSKLWTAVNVVSDDNSFHPIRDYLNGLLWDGVPRLDSVLCDFLGAADTPYIRAVARKSLTAAVARVFRPGVKFDCMPVLIGSQGIYKSSFVRLLAPTEEWYFDDLKNFSGKAAQEDLQGIWIAEIAELQALKNADVEQVKAFLSRVTDRYRPAYARKSMDFPRQCVFWGSTNVCDFLRDTTGNRRFWPIECDQQERTKDVFKDLPRERDQLWAEAYVRYQEHEPLHLSKELEATARQVQEDHREIDLWESLLLDFIEKPIPENWVDWPIGRRRDFWAGGIKGDVRLVPRQAICAAEFMVECLHFDDRHLNKNNQTRVGKLMRTLSLRGWTYEPQRTYHPY